MHEKSVAQGKRLPAQVPHCLTAGGQVGELMRSLDWAASGFGPIESWSEALQLSISLCLNSRFPLILWWGPDLLMLYNDPYTEHLQSKHPYAMAKPGRDVWTEIWPVIGPMLEGVFTTGEPTWSDDLHLLLNRNGFAEETYHTFSYSAIKDSAGKIVGIFTPVAETTERVISARRMRTLKDLASSSRATTEDQLYLYLADALNANNIDLPAWGLFRVKQKEGRFDLICHDNQQILPQAGDLTSTTIGQKLAHCAHDNVLLELNPLPEELSQLPAGVWGERSTMAIMTPLSVHTENEILVLFSTLSPHRPWDDNYRSFLQAIAREISTSITEVRALEVERLRAEKLAELDKAKTLFFSNVSHEFRTPLTLMLGPLQAILETDMDLDKAKAEVAVAYRNALRLQRLVNSLLDFSRIEAGRIDAVYEATELALLTSELASTFRSAIESAGLTLDVKCQSLKEPAYVDRDMWEKIVLNLISNAFKYTLAGSITVSLEQKANTIELTVADTGSGISEDELPNIFKRFHRARSSKSRTHEGTGIGLALVDELVKLHGGKIDVKSVPDKGSSFAVSIPLGKSHLPQESLNASRRLPSTAIGASPFVKEAARWMANVKPADFDDTSMQESGQSIARAETKTDASDPTTKILVVDDNADMRDYLVRLLEPNWTVVAATDGLAAWEAIKAENFDLIVTDVMMPRLDGFQLLELIRKTDETKTLPVIMLSARAGEDSHIEGLESGADDYLSKPFSARELTAHVSANLKLAALRRDLMTAIAEEHETAQKAINESLARLAEQNANQARILSVLEKSPDFIGMVDAATNHLSYLNPAAMKIVNINENDDLSQFLIQDIVTADVLPLHDRSVSTATVNGYWEGEMTFKDQVTGQPIAMYQRLWPIVNDKQAIVHFATIATPMSDQKRMDEVLGVLGQQKSLNEELQAALAELQNVAYVVSHELQEPIQTIKSYQNLLAVRYRGRLGTDADEFIEKCASASSITHRMVDDLWEYARINQIFLGLTDSTRALGMAVETLKGEIEKSGARLEYGVLPEVMADEKLLVNLFVRLLDNAIKYRREGVQPIIRVDVENEERAWVFKIQDNGCGIDPMTGKDIFKIFYRGEGRRPGPDGTGMGLPIAKKIVEYFDGMISFESKPGSGSTFMFTMPRIGSSKRARGQAST